MHLQRFGLDDLNAQHVNAKASVNFGHFERKKWLYTVGICAGVRQPDIQPLHGLVATIGL